jgi:flavin-dependent dehydrogenase
MAAANPPIEVDHDIIIVGAGPVGSFLGLNLLKANPSLRVLVMESRKGEQFTKYHHKCGEGIDIRTKELMDGHAVIMNHQKSIIYHLGPDLVYEQKAGGCIINRPETFLSVLREFEGLGGTVVNDQFVSAALDERGRVNVTTNSGTMTCRLLVGADGPNSRVRTSCGFETPEIITIMQYLVDEPMRPDITEIWFDTRYGGGYRYRFPYGSDKHKVGFERGMDKYDGPFEELQARQCAISGLSRFYKEGILLVGDAGGQANPISGAGIKQAVIAAKWISRVVAASCKGTIDLTIGLRRAAARFERKWLRSWYNAQRYAKLRSTLKAMDEATLVQFLKPAWDQNVARSIGGVLSHPSWWGLYSVLVKVDRYS